MSSEQKSVKNFLGDLGMLPDSVDVKDLAGIIMKEMQEGLDGRPSSLPMLPTYTDVPPLVPGGEEVVVIDAGGTNLRVARVAFNSEGHPKIIDFAKERMPGTEGYEVSAEDFFQHIASTAYPLLHAALVSRAGHSSGNTAGVSRKKPLSIGFCFSYAMEMTEDRDGELIYWSKEIKASGVIGLKIGASLKEAIKKLGWEHELEVFMLNDAVATLLCGLSGEKREWSGHAGFILGTGMNASYVELNARTGKIHNAHGQQMINCEAGSFRVPVGGMGDKRLRARTKDPEKYWIEKMIAGCYFGSLLGEVLVLAAERDGGPFSLKAATVLSELANRDEITTKDADGYCYNPHNADNKLVRVIKSSGNDSDAQCLWFLIDFLIERGAKLTASQMAAVLLKGRGFQDVRPVKPEGSPVRPVCLCVDGTAFFRFYRFPERVNRYLRPLMSDCNIYYEIVKAEDAPVTGAAVAALSGRHGEAS